LCIDIRERVDIASNRSTLNAFLMTHESHQHHHDPQHAHFMRRAIELSLESVVAHRGGPFGAVVVKDGAIIGEGFNCVTAHNDPTAHAEIVAIRAACARIAHFDLQGAVLYTSCEPCPMCLSAIYWARLGAIYYANTKCDAAAIAFDDDFIYRQLAEPAASRTIPMTQLLRSEAQVAFVAWTAQADKIRY
jgi:tRNA(Arg) A34 adenosine deaminase TadA